jgi:small GTP-binding protein
MTKNIKLNETEVHFSLWDFAGEHKFRQLFPAYCSGASGALILFDLTNKETFDDLNDWVQLINNASDNIVKILVASKADLETERQISSDKAMDFLTKNKLDVYLETSAKTGKNVDAVFSRMAELIVNKSLKPCPNCKELIPKDLYFCTYCGAKIKSD